MPYDGSGNFNRVMRWQNDAASMIKIRADRHDQEDDNFAAGLSNVITRDGQSPPTADLPMGGRKLLNLAAPTNPTDAATKGYADAIRNFNSAINLTGAVPEARIGFTQADIGFGARVAGTPAGTLNRFVWNTEPDLSGTDLMALTDAGNLALLVGGLFGAGGTGGLGLWARSVSDAASVGAHIGLRASGNTGNPGGIDFYTGTTSGNFNPALHLFVDNSATFTGSVFTKGNGSAGISNQNRSTLIDNYKMVGGNAFRWLRSSTGLSAANGGAGVTILASLNDDGSFVATGHLVANGYVTSSAATLIMGMASAVAGNIYLRPNGVTNIAGETRFDNVGNQSTKGGIYAEAFNIGWNGMTTSVANWLTNTGAVGFHIDYASAFPAMRFYLGSVQTFQSPSGIWTFPANCTKPGGGPFGDSSDERIKNVVGEYDRGLDAIMGLRPVVYTFKGNDTPDPPSATPGPPSEGDDDSGLVAPYANSNHYMQAEAGTQFVGLIAQEVEAVMPGMVTQRSGYIDGEPVDDIRDLDTTILIFAVVNSIKELATRVEQLEQAA